MNAVRQKDPVLCFLDITHRRLIDGIFVVSDTKDFMLDGQKYVGFTFDIVIPDDTDQPPKAKLVLQNVDPRIGDTVRGLMTPLNLKIRFYSAKDFNQNTDPRTPFGTPDVLFVADKLFISKVSVDILTIEGEISGWDYLQRVWPGVRATEDLLEALFRN
jgi:hypothetical protein